MKVKPQDFYEFITKGIKKDVKILKKTEYLSEKPQDVYEFIIKAIKNDISIPEKTKYLSLEEIFRMDISSKLSHLIRS